MDRQDSTAVVSIEWAVAARPLPGEQESGDLHLVKEVKNGYVVAVVDGLGHGPAAAVAARIAVKTLESSVGQSVIDLIRLCHQALKHSRGVVLTLATIDARNGLMTWAGVGNVEGVLLRGDAHALPPREHALPRGGVVGEQLPPVRESVVTVVSGDTMILATDGIGLRFVDDLDSSHSPLRIADDILMKHGKSTDDALVLVVRFLGSGRE